MMKFMITLDRDEDGVWVAECPSIPGCVSQGKTRPAILILAANRLKPGLQTLEGPFPIVRSPGFSRPQGRSRAKMRIAETRQEALDNARQAIALCLEVRAERGLALTVGTSRGRAVR